jgi:predicted nucleic acid-binding protein
LIYLDSAAVVKLVRSEAESPQLVDWLVSHAGSALVSSVLVEVEVARALRRVAPTEAPGVAAVLGRMIRWKIDDAVRARAAAYPNAALRSLDAIHLATAELVDEEGDAELEAFVTYDTRLAAAAAALGLPTVSPGW